jgi:hypothetical protein
LPAAVDPAAPLLLWLSGVMEAKHGIGLGKADLDIWDADQHPEQAVDLAEGPGKGPAEEAAHSALPMLELVFDDRDSVVPSGEVGRRMSHNRGWSQWVVALLPH